MTNKEFDYIVIGAGAAGCTLAREIMARDMGSALLVESGDEPRSRSLRVPSQYLHSFGSRWDWSYETRPQTQLANRSIRLPAGHTLGGSTAINAMIWIEPKPKDFDAWEQRGGPSWSSDSVGCMFVEARSRMTEIAQCWSDDCQLPSLPPLHPNMQRLLDQAVEHGWTASSYPHGLNQPSSPGIDAYQRMQHRGRRVSQWDLLKKEFERSPSAIRGRLTVMSNMHAHRLQFRGQRAVGVQCRSHVGEASTFTAARGVLLCAGAIETPRLLMASGVGPKERLEWAGIPCREDLPELGSHLQDHLVFPVVMRLDSAKTESDSNRRSRQQRLEYVRYRTGALSSNLAELGGFFEESDLFQWHITPTHYLEPIPFRGPADHISFGVTSFGRNAGGSVLPAASRGAWDQDGRMPVSIDPHYLSLEEDKTSFLDAIETTRQKVQSSPWQSWLGREVFPRCSDRDRLLSYLRRFAGTIYHYAGSCALGESKSSCLTPSLEVRGVENLWVCDASAMPRLVRCNPQATVVMMAMHWIHAHSN
jgi:choline dehydrogenase